MFHIPLIFILYGVAQFVHIVCTYYDHKNNTIENCKHKMHQENSSRKINELEDIVKKLNNALENKLKTGLEKDVNKLIEKVF